MGAAVGLGDDFTAAELRRLAGKAKDADQVRRLLALAAVYEGMDRATAARIGGMDRQTLRDWAHRFNEYGPVGLINVKPAGRRPKLSVEQQGLCGNWWRPAPIRRRMEWSAGDAWTCSVSSERSSVSICRQSRSGEYSRNSNSPISARDRNTPHRIRRRLRLLKKLPRSGRRGCEYASRQRSVVISKDVYFLGTRELCRSVHSSEIEWPSSKPDPPNWQRWQTMARRRLKRVPDLARLQSLAF